MDLKEYVQFLLREQNKIAIEQHILPKWNEGYREALKDILKKMDDDYDRNTGCSLKHEIKVCNHESDGRKHVFHQHDENRSLEIKKCAKCGKFYS